MADGGQQMKRNQSNISTCSSRRSPNAGLEVHNSSVTDGGSSRQEVDMNILQLEVSHSTPSQTKIMEGITYEIDQKSMPPEAPLNLKSVRAVLVSEKTRLQVTVSYPSTASLEKFFRKFPEYAVQDLQYTPRKLTRYSMQMGYVEPLMGTKPDLDESFDMKSEMAEKILVRAISCTEYLHQAHLKSFWLMGPDSTQSSEANFMNYNEQMKHQKRPSSTMASESSAPNNYHTLGGGQADQVTQDLCNNFETWIGRPAQREEALQLPWKKTRMAPNGQILHSRVNTEEGPIATIPVTHHGKPAEEGGLCHMFLSEKHGVLQGSELLSEGSFRWGLKKKVNFSGITRNFDMYDMQDVTGVNDGRREKVHDLYKRRELPHDNEVNLVPYDFMQSNRGPWAATLSATPTSGDLYSSRASTSRGLKRALSSNALSLREKSHKIHQSRSPVNMLKLPKDMQGRWSSDRYKSAQLKLIDIMHERRAAPGRPILRPALREEARKHIGDTGLLDHLLKHMTDTVVSTGERFRRRHNAEGAMEYWLEDASLMEIRKAAGVEDPSWLPPQGWKPGDKLPGGPWEFNRGMSSSEAAEMKQLKDTVEKLKSEMRFLCGRLKGFKQKRVLQVHDIMKGPETEVKQYVDRDPKRDELNKEIENISMEVKDFRRDMTTLQKQYDKDLRTNMSSERFQILEHEVQQLTKEQQEEQTIAGSNDLETQLADVRKEVDVMQADVQCISKILGFPQERPPPQYTSPCHGGSGNIIPLLLSAGGEGLRATVLSERRTPASSSVGGVAAQYDPTVGRIANVNSATSSSTDGAAPVAKEANVVKESLAVQVMGNTSCLNNIASISSAMNLPASQIKPGGITGFKVCRPPGSFLWPNMVSASQYTTIQSGPTKASRWDDFINLSPRDQQGNASSTGSPEGSSMQYTISDAARSSARECHVAAAMAGMFGCMVQQQPSKGDHSGHTNTFQQQLRTSFENSTVNNQPVTATNLERGMIGHDAKLLSAFGNTTGASPTISVVPQACGHQDPPVCLSLSLTLGSRASSDHFEAYPTEKHA